MSNSSIGDDARGNLRTAIAAIDHEFARLPPDGEVSPLHELRASWSELVKLLALGPAPETRQCPVCGSTGMAAASRCGHCWSKLVPLLSAPGHGAALIAQP